MRYIDKLDFINNPTYEREYKNLSGKTVKVTGYNNTPSEKALNNFTNKLIEIANTYIEKEVVN
jgi:RNase adaptor protein for sRNA GlmZ degradation